jgi:hypothetical protein
MGRLWTVSVDRVFNRIKGLPRDGFLVVFKP